MKKRKICVVTTSRADYGLLYWLMKEISRDNDLILQVIVTGMHLSPEFGSTYKVIENDGFFIDKQIELLMSADTESSVIKSIGVGCIGFSDALKDLAPDLLVVLGDRYELLAVSISAVILKIPIAHIHGGEITQGAIDDIVRHAVTKMSTFHFASTEIYRRRIIQMGEDPERVFNFGAVGLDNIYKLKLYTTEELEKLLDFGINCRTAMVTYHPPTLEVDISVEKQIENILLAIKQAEINVLFTSTNADAEGRIINKKIQEFCSTDKSKYRFVHNLGQTMYLSCLKNFSIMIGNSSSGIIEAPTVGIPVVNIGDRQKGRVKADNVLDSGYKVNDILKMINKGLSASFKEKLKKSNNPYDKYRDGKTSLKIKDILKSVDLSNEITQKKFYDIKIK